MAPSTPHPNAVFKHLKTYPNTDYLTEAKKRYRQVFEQGESTYLYAELAFHNKQFDRMSWFATVTFACYGADIPGEQGAEVCVIKNEYPVSKDTPIMAIREGYGNAEPGVFWKAGRYVWHTWMDGHYMGQRVFYVENGGLAANGKNPYCAPGEVRFFEGPIDLPPQGQRAYKTAFRAAEARYIWLELQLDNLAQDRAWTGEFFLRIFNEAMELKGENVDLVGVPRTDATFEFTSGWGAESRGTWHPGKYTALVVFMNQVIAHQEFTILPDSQP